MSLIKLKSYPYWFTIY